MSYSDAEMQAICREMRADLLNMTHRAGNMGAHIGGSLSLVEIMATLYLKVANIGKDLLDDDARDRIILSKGHGAMTQYAAMQQAGIIGKEELFRYKENSGAISAHPSMNGDIGIEYSSGSLGQGLSLGVGACLAMVRRGNISSKVFVIVGDGECDEGQIWEAAMTAAHYKLDNLVCIVDENHLQYDGPTDDIQTLGSLQEKFEAFGWKAVSCDGHDIVALVQSFKTDHAGAPLAVIASTVKGKGVSFMENNPLYHNNRLTDSQLEQALSEVGGC